MAGLELKIMVDEPTAAAIAYNADKKLENSRILIFDFGGGKIITRINKLVFRRRLNYILKFRNS